MCAGVDKSVLLQTARATVYNPQKPQLSLRVRAILDSGSQRSYVTNKIKSALSLTPEGTQMLQSRRLVLKGDSQRPVKSFVSQ